MILRSRVWRYKNLWIGWSPVRKYIVGRFYRGNTKILKYRRRGKKCSAVSRVYYFTYPRVCPLERRATRGT